MTGDQLKAWREARGLSQDQLAELLGELWTRQRLANVETARTALVEDLTSKLMAIDDLLMQRARANAGAEAQAKKGRFDYSRHKCWDLHGQPINAAEVLLKPLGFHFYRLDNAEDVDPETGHIKANLYETTRKRKHGQCTYFALDLVDWCVICIAYPDLPAHVAALPKLQALLGPRSAAL